jgi:hypothetical protein
MDMASCPLIPPNEKERLQVLYESDILNSNKNDSDYDRYTALCTRLFNAPSANIILVGKDSIFVKSLAEESHTTNTSFDYPRSPSVAELYIFPDRPEVVVIPDILDYHRFSLFFQRKINIRFLASCALIVEGMKIGFIGITDFKPRHDFDLKQQMNLLDIGASVSSLIAERRRSLMNLREIESLKQMNRMVAHTGVHLAAMSLEARAKSTDEDDIDLIIPIESSNFLKTCLECDVCIFMDMSKQILSRRFDSDRITWFVSKSFYESKGHTTYAYAVFSVLVVVASSILKHRSDHVEIRIGFKKSHSLRNHRGLLTNHQQQDIIDGNISLEFHFNQPLRSIDESMSMDHLCPITKPVTAYMLAVLIQRTLGVSTPTNLPMTDCDNFAIYVNVIDDILRDIHGSSRYSELHELSEISREFISIEDVTRCEGFAQVKPERSSFYDVSIPCLCRR